MASPITESSTPDQPPADSAFHLMEHVCFMLRRMAPTMASCMAKFESSPEDVAGMAQALRIPLPEFRAMMIESQPHPKP